MSGSAFAWAALGGVVGGLLFNALWYLWHEWRRP